jgi:hypothetical protein
MAGVHWVGMASTVPQISDADIRLSRGPPLRSLNGTSRRLNDVATNLAVLAQLLDVLASSLLAEPREDAVSLRPGGSGSS